MPPEYLLQFEPDVPCGHYAFVWLPWYQRLPDHLNEADAGSAADIYLWVEMYFQAIRHEYRPAYRAVVRYGGEALPPAEWPRHPALVCSRLTGLLRCAQQDRRTMTGRLAPPIHLADDGSHWYRTWLMLRDSLVRWPWFAREPAALSRQQLACDAREVHE